jgi:hypothetical protein
LLIFYREFTSIPTITFDPAVREQLVQRLRHENIRANIHLDTHLRTPPAQLEPPLATFLTYPCALNEYLNKCMAEGAAADAPANAIEKAFESMLKVFETLLELKSHLRMVYTACLSIGNMITMLFMHDPAKLVQTLRSPKCIDCVRASMKCMIALVEHISTGGSVDDLMYETSVTTNKNPSRPLSRLSTAGRPLSTAISDPIVTEIPWLTNLVDLDLNSMANYFSTSVKILLMTENTTDALVLGTKFNKITCGYYGQLLLEMLIAAAEKLSKSTRELNSQLSRIKRDENKSLAQLDASRATLGTWILGACGIGDATNVKDVIESYEKSCTVLRQKHEVLALMQALNELGDLYHYTKQFKKAVAVWTDATDCIFESVNTIDDYEKIVRSRGGQSEVLKKIGVHKCVLGVSVIGKIANYRLHSSDYSGCSRCCLFIADLLGSLFSSSLEHPQRPCDFSSHTIEALFPDTFTDWFRCNGRQVLDSVQMACHFLAENGHYLRSLYVSSFYEYVACHVVREVACTVDARMMKAQALMEIGYLKDAANIIIGIYQGKNLPEKTLGELSITFQPFEVPEKTGKKFYSSM